MNRHRILWISGLLCMGGLLYFIIPLVEVMRLSTNEQAIHKAETEIQQLQQKLDKILEQKLALEEINKNQSKQITELKQELKSFQASEQDKNNKSLEFIERVYSDEIAFLVTTYPNHHRSHAIGGTRTWMPHFNKSNIVFISNIGDNITNINGYKLVEFGDNSQGHEIRNKTFLGFKYVWENIVVNNTKIKWIMKLDDDTLLFPENLMRALSNFRHSEQWYLGHTLPVGYIHSGGSGYILSRPTLELLYPLLDTCLANATLGEDIEISKCLNQSMGDKFKATNIPGFYNEDIFSYYRFEHHRDPNYTTYPVTFHRMDANHMTIYFWALYQAKIDYSFASGTYPILWDYIN